MKKILLGWVISCGLTAAHASSGAGNGGDSAERLLAASRGAIVQTLRSLLVTGTSAPLCRCERGDAAGVDALFCRHLERLTGDEARYCDGFFRGVMTQVTGLANDEKRTEFLLSTEPLKVDSPTGLRPVLAKTLPAAAGPIWFDYFRLRELVPATAVALMAHEFAHKSLYPTLGHFLTDDESVGPFGEAGGGRKLLDAFGSAVAMQAQRLGYVGRTSPIRDKFRCTIEPIEPLGFPFFATGTSTRIESGEGYETGVGVRPGDFSCALRDGNGLREVSAVLKISEPNGCVEGYGAGRETQLQVWDIHRRRENGWLAVTTTPIVQMSAIGWNPVCGEAQHLAIDAVVDAKKYRFTIVYDGSEAAKK